MIFCVDNRLKKNRSLFQSNLSDELRCVLDAWLSDATEDVMRKTKNINMSERKAPEVSKSTNGMQVKALNPDSGRNLKIRSMKKI